MSKFVKLLFACALIAVAVAVCTTGAFAKKNGTVGPYVVTNDDVYNSTTPSNTATVYSIGAGGALTLVKSLPTGGTPWRLFLQCQRCGTSVRTACRRAIIS